MCGVGRPSRSSRHPGFQMGINLVTCVLQRGTTPHIGSVTWYLRAGGSIPSAEQWEHNDGKGLSSRKQVMDTWRTDALNKTRLTATSEWSEEDGSAVHSLSDENRQGSCKMETSVVTVC